MPDDDDQRLPEQLAELEAANDGLRREIAHFRRAEEGLRFGEERYRSLVEATTAIVWNTPAAASSRSSSSAGAISPARRSSSSRDGAG